RRREMIGGLRWLLWKTGDEGPACIAIPDGEGMRKYAIAWTTASPQESGREGTLSCHVETRYPLRAGFMELGPIKFGTGLIHVNGANLSYEPSQLFIKSNPGAGLIETQAGGFHTPLHEAYSEAYRQGRRKELIQLLAEVVPGLDDVAQLTENGQPIIHL